MGQNDLLAKQRASIQVLAWRGGCRGLVLALEEVQNEDGLRCAAEGAVVGHHEDADRLHGVEARSTLQEKAALPHLFTCRRHSAAECICLDSGVGQSDTHEWGESDMQAVSSPAVAMRAMEASVGLECHIDE